MRVCPFVKMGTNQVHWSMGTETTTVTAVVCEVIVLGEIVTVAPLIEMAFSTF